MLTSGSLLGTGRDGFLLATLTTGENTSICNYKFAEVDANVACSTLGYPAQGLSLVNPKGIITGSVLIGDMACTGIETNINSCLNSGKKVFTAPCSTHTMDAYVYCLQPKTTPIIAPTVNNTICGLSNGSFKFQKLPKMQNSGFLMSGDSYVCNDDYSVTSSSANGLCQLFCSGVINPLPSMFVSGVIGNFTHVRLNTQTYVTVPVICSSPLFSLVLQCGPEPTVIESPPNVTCDIASITATWNTGFNPPINVNLLTTPMSCTILINSSSSYDAIVTFTYKNCSPIVTADSRNIYYSYWITRAYVASGITSISPRNLTISCSFPKANMKNQSIIFQNPSLLPLGSFAEIPTTMIFYNDASFQTLMPSPYNILDNQLMYVKVQLMSQLSTLILGLVNCKVSTDNSMIASDITNSIALITNSCPNENVVVYPLDSKNIGFQFQPMKINNINKVYVICETTKCYINSPSKDNFCLFCQQSGRRKRSAILTNEVVLGPIFVFN